MVGGVSSVTVMVWLTVWTCSRRRRRHTSCVSRVFLRAGARSRHIRRDRLSLSECCSCPSPSACRRTGSQGTRWVPGRHEREGRSRPVDGHAVVDRGGVAAHVRRGDRDRRTAGTERARRLRDLAGAVIRCNRGSDRRRFRVPDSLEAVDASVPLVTVGGVLSFTVISCVQVAELPHTSVAR